MKSRSNLEKFEVIKKSYLLTKDIAILLDCGANKAIEYKKAFLQAMTEQEKNLLDIPTIDFIDYYKIDTERIIKYAKLEKQLA